LDKAFTAFSDFVYFIFRESNVLIIVAQLIYWSPDLWITLCECSIRLCLRNQWPLSLGMTQQ